MPVRYTRVGWQDAPSTDTPIDAANLNHMDNGILALSQEVDTELDSLREDFTSFEEETSTRVITLQNSLPTMIGEQIDTKFGDSITDEITSWLNTHVDPAGSAVVVDDTLSVEGAAADAKKTGTLIRKNAWTGVCSTGITTQDKVINLDDATGFINGVYGTNILVNFLAPNKNASPRLKVGSGIAYPVAYPTSESPYYQIMDAEHSAWGLGVKRFMFMEDCWLLMNPDFVHTNSEFDELKDGLSATLDGISIAKTDTASHAISRVRINWETGEDITEAVKYYSTGRLSCDFCVGLVAKQGYKFRIAFYSSGVGAYSDAYIGNNGNYITQYTVYGAPYYRICFTTTDGSSIASGTTIYDMCDITLYSSLPVDNQSNINALCGEVKDDISLIPTQTWESGYINSSGSNANGTKYLRTNTYYASDRDGEISITLNADYKVGIAEYDANHTFKARYTWFEFGHTVKCKKGYTYRFMILNIAGDDISSLANDPAFIASIKIGYSTIHKQIADLQEKSIRILGIGNSYTWYVYKYLCKILQECGYSEVVVGQCYKGGCTLEEQYTNRTATDFYDYYRKYNNNGLTKKDTQNVSLDTALQDEKWDYIIFQQQSDDSGQYTSFVNAGFSINDFLAYVKQYQPDAKIGLVSPWTHATGYSGTKFVEYYDGSVSQQNTAINQVMPQVMAIMSQCDMLIDFNHLVNYARQNTYLGTLGDEMLQPDKNHIAYGMPDYMCGCLYALCVGANIDKMSWYPTVSDDSSITTTCDNHLAWLARQFAKAVYSGANLIV